MGKLNTIVLLTLCSMATLQAQDIASASLRWTCTGTTDLRSQSSRDYSCVFVTEAAASRITWLQRNGQVRTTYVVTSTEGAWRDVSASGSFIYHLSRDGKAGQMTVQRTAEGITITLDFSSSGEMAIKRQFRVSEIQPDR